MSKMFIIIDIMIWYKKKYKRGKNVTQLVTDK